MRVYNWKSAFIFAFFFLGLLAGQTPAAAQSWSNGYINRRIITLDHTQVPNTDQNNFPVLISGTYSYLATTSNGGNVTNANGYDIIFTSDAAGTTPLAFERESYNASTGAVNFWVKVPTLSHTADTVLYLFYGNSSVTTDQSNKTAVWDSNFKGVWHLNETSGTVNSDSTSNAINANKLSASSPSPAAGLFGGVQSFNGSTDYITVANTPAIDVGGANHTVGIWFKANSYSSYSTLFTKEANPAGTTNRDYSFWINSASNGWWAAGNSGSGLGWSSPGFTTGGWHYLVMTRTGSAEVAYLDGSAKVSATFSGTTDSGGNLEIGADHLFANGLYWNGSLGEMRISNIARSADWIATEYNNQSAPSTFYSIGSANSGGSGPASITATAGSPQSATVNTAFAMALQATVKNATNNPVSGVTVTFTAPGSGASGTFGGSTAVTTNSSGVATAPALTANSVAGSYTVTASVSSVSTPASFSLTNNAGLPASIIATAGTPQSAKVNTAFGIALQATVKDAGNNPVNGVTVTFAAPGSGASGTFGGATAVTTNGSGVATAPALTANSAAGSYTVTASVSGVATPASFNLTNNAAVSNGIKLIQQNVNGNESGTANMSVSFTSNNTAGNFLIVTGSAARPASTLSVSDTLGNSYSTAFGPVTDTTQNVTIYVWYVPICKGGANTVTITPSGTAALEIHVSEWSGLASTSPVDQTASATGTGTSVSSGVKTTTINGELVFGYSWVFSSASAGTGFTPISLVNGDLDEYQIQPTAGSIATTFTQTSGTWFAAMVTFKPVGWTISGAITGGAGALVTLSGASGATVTADSSGNYTFNGLSNGTYTVTPSESGFSFTPPSQTVVVNGASVPGVNFTASGAIPVLSVSPQTLSFSASAGGSNPAPSTISVANSGSGTLNFTASSDSSWLSVSPVSGTAPQSLQAAASITGLAVGTYTGHITIAPSGAQGSPVIVTVTLFITGTGTLSIDATVSKDNNTAGNTIVSPAFSTGSGNELLLAFVSSDYQKSQSSTNVSVSGITGGGLSWVLVKKTNTQLGTAEIWRAFAPSPLSNVTVTATLTQSVQSSMTVMSFMGVDTTGTNGSGAIGAIGSGNASTGAPTATLVTTRNNSWVVGSGNDYDNAIARTLGPGQTMVHQDLSPIKDTYWVQRQSSATALSGTSVTINDTAPTGDRYNLSIAEVLPSSNQAPIPDLTITKSHSGNFVQGQMGANYTITVTNSGGAATSGTVTMTDTLPPSLTLTAISGTNWNCTLATLTCTRSDVLAAGGSYPVITLTVNVAGNAPASITNTATVSGGGETNTANDTANDLTTVTSIGGLVHVGGASGHPVVTNQMMTFNYTPVGTSDAVVILIGCRSPGVTSMSLTAPGWTFAAISGLVGPSGHFDFISTFGAITPNTAPVTWTVTLTGGNGNCTSNDTTVLVDEFSGSDLTGGTTTFEAHNESLDTSGGTICTGAAVTPASNNDAIWYGCFDNVTGVNNGYVKGQDDATGDWSEYKILSGGSGVAQNPGFVTNPSFFSFGLGGVAIKPATGGAPTTYTLSGTISPAASGNGSTVTLTGPSTGTLTTTADSNGNFMFTGLANGTYTVTPTKTGFVFKPSSRQNVIVNGANVTGINFASGTGLSVAISPKRGGLSVTQALPISATVLNDVGGAGVTWVASGSACSGTSCGTFVNVTSTSATYVAPSTAGVYSITATSVADNTKSATAVIGVTDLAGVRTWRNDVSRSGVNSQEYALTPLNVTSSTFGKVFSCPVDGWVFGQPLWVANVSISGAQHNVVFAATENDSVYAFDADGPGCKSVWPAPSVSLIPSGEKIAPLTDLENDSSALGPVAGITGTPVIDPSSQTLYLVALTENSTTGAIIQRLHAIDITTGHERIGSPVAISASVSGTGYDNSNGTITFNAKFEKQRPALLLLNGVIYISWASYNDTDFYHGWVIGYDASTLAQVTIFNDTPDGGRGGIWMSGGGPAADSQGNIFLMTGNGDFNANTTGGRNYGDTFLKFGTSGGLSVSDWFTPHDQAALAAADQDLGGGGAVILIDQASGPHPHLILGGAKAGTLYVVDRDNLGHYNTSSDSQIVQSFTLGSNGIYSAPLFWQNTLYAGASSARLSAYSFSPATDQFQVSPSSVSGVLFGFPGTTPALSAAGTNGAILWAIERPSSSAVLHAYDPTNLNNEFWNSSQAANNRDKAGTAVKFTVPTIANGKVYIGTQTELDVYGLLPN